MATSLKKNAIQRILEVLKFEKKEISAIYFYAVFSGLVQLSLPLGIQSIISFVMGGAISTSLVLLIILVVAGVFLGGLLQVNQMKIIEKIQQQLFVRYSFLYAYTIPKVNLKGIDSYYFPELVNRFFDTVSLQKGLSKLLLDIPAATIQILFGLILLSFYHPVFIFFSLILIVIVYGILRFSGNRGLETSIEESNYKYNVAGWLQEMARVVTSIKFGHNSFLHLYKTDREVTGYLDARTRHFRILLVQYWSLIAFKVIITAAMLIVGSFLLVNQQLNIGQFIAAEIVIITVMNSVEKLISNLDKVYDVLTSVEKLAKVTEKPLEANGNLPPLAESAKGMTLSLKDVGFAYDEENPVLQQVSFTANPGDKIAVTGKLGSGKSTLLRVLTGSYQPYKGSITIDGLPLGNYDLNTLRSQTGILLENQDIFEGTLLENITMGDPEIRLERILYLAEKVGLKDFLDNTSGGIEMPLHPTGKRLPRKIVQKVLLMRALIRKPRLLLLEEPWLVLEEQHAAKVKQLLLEEFRDTTLIVVTTDESFMTSCNQIIHLENGTIKK